MPLQLPEKPMRLRAALLALPLLALSLPALAEEPKFDPAAIRAHVTFLADDLLEGRDTGSRGYDIAAAYVASQFMGIGLEPVGDPASGSYFQRLTIREARVEGQPKITLSYGGKDTVLDSSAAMLVGASLAERALTVEAPLVFVGYGFDRPDLGMADYRGLDVKGKIVVVLSGFPKGMPSELGASLASDKSVMAMKRGAVGIITVPTLQDTARRSWEKRVELSDSPTKGWLTPAGEPFRRAPGIRAGAVLNPDVAAAPLFAAARRPLPGILAQADKTGGRPRGFALNARARIEVDSTWKDVESHNVVAVLPGSDPALAGEYVALTAHLDHLGMHGKGEDKISNGAMDNAAGVATMIEVAKTLAAAPEKQRRPVLFAAFTGEEGGLLGSDYLARNPVIGGGEVVGLVNFDMPVLTYPFADVIAFGAENSTLGPMVASAAQKAGIALSPDPMPEEGLFTRSDHYRFVQQGVPSVFLMTGFANGGEAKFRDFLKTHYHQPSDDLNLPVDWQAGAKFAQVNYYIVQDLANADKRPLWYASSFFGKEFAPKAEKAPPPVK
jgi:hypothetical protein